jgi:hypothetical protein
MNETGPISQWEKTTGVKRMPIARFVDWGRKLAVDLVSDDSVCCSTAHRRRRAILSVSRGYKESGPATRNMPSGKHM